jgi:hypothetical protein
VLYGLENVSSSPNLSHIVCYPFQIMNNINRCTISIQNIINILKKKATWDEPIEEA